MAISKDLQILLEFVDMINTNDSTALKTLMSDDHIFIDLSGDEVRGKDLMQNAWEGYMTAFPEYHIYIEKLYEMDDKFVFIGTTTGSHLGLNDEEEFFNQSALWIAKIHRGLVSLWQILPHNEINRESVGISNEFLVDETIIYSDFEQKRQELLCK